ncbi:alpha/beta fold hydrolase [Novosphingobium panipatense]|uniref:alpha/beta fold hydrolase n=1 Tax=Novosphingobium panipatense TaxID=428991 RepID=UPI0039A35AF9
MSSPHPAPHTASPRIVRRFVNAGSRRVHLREAGAGKPVILLHDSPRSSRLHIDLMHFLAPHFRVVALDTAGYGNSDPLGADRPEIADFAAALGECLDALELADAPIYATHTSAKIALEYAFATGRPPALVLDGLAYPPTLAPPAFIDAYMRPFEIDSNGAYIAAEWTRVCDMLRWFPWFSPTAANRVLSATPSAEWIAHYTIDLFSAGPHYADAYAAAMRYDCGPALRGIGVPTVVAARRDDVLYGFLNRVPVDENPLLTVERLAPDRTLWCEWLLQRLLEASHAAPDATPIAGPGPNAGYLDHAGGQIRYDRRGPKGGSPLLILEAPAPLEAILWQASLAEDHDVIVPELPGFGDSDPLENATSAGYVSALESILATIGEKVDVLAIGPATYLALALAAQHPDRLRAIVLDGAPHAPADLDALGPSIGFDMGGGHLHRTWHMLRDAQVQWPWYSAAAEAQRRTKPTIGGEALHRALIGTIKQPAHHADALRAALSAPACTTQHPALIFTRDGDPFYAGAPRLAEELTRAHCVVRDDGIVDAAPRIARFLADCDAESLV